MAYDLRVTFWDPVQPSRVRRAVAEYDKPGPDEFLALSGGVHGAASALQGHGFEIRDVRDRPELQ